MQKLNSETEMIEATSLVALAVSALILGVFMHRKRAREGSGLVRYEVIEVKVPRFWYRAAQNPVVFWATSALTGVSISFAPLFIFFLARDGVKLPDWRLVACFVTIYVVPMMYIGLGGPVLGHAWKARRGSPPSA